MTTVLVLIRTVHIGSAMLIVALSYFMRAVLSNKLVPDFANRMFARTMEAWFCSALITTAISGAGWFWLVATQMCGQSPWAALSWVDLSTVLEQTHFGELWLGRLAIGLVLAGATFFARRKTPPNPGPSFITDWLVLGLGICLLITLAWAGHAASGIHHRALHLLVDVLHLLVGSVWPMGLIPLLIFLRLNTGEIQPGYENTILATLNRFSHNSVIAVLLLTGTGLINGWLMIGAWSNLVTTTYGRLLMTKIFIAGLMICLGAWNRHRLLRSGSTEHLALDFFRRTILAESSLTLIVLLIVGLMGTTPPPS